MNRRRFLAHVGAGTVVAVGGCLGATGTRSDSDGTIRPAMDAQPCPPFSIDRDRAVCSHTVDRDTASVYLDPEPHSSTLNDGTPAEEITLTLHNQSATDLRFNPHSWRIWHQSDSDWTELQQHSTGDGVVTVHTSNTYTWSFLEAVESIQAEPEVHAGLYAGEISVPAPATDDWIACIALVRFEPAG